MRPTERPERPYTAEEILDRIEQHFVVEGNPLSTDAEGGWCKYAGTGCAVGCLVTEDDAESWDELGPIRNVRSLQKEYRDYFGRDAGIYGMLARLQNVHDDSESGEDLAGIMRDAIAAERRRLEATP